MVAQGKNNIDRGGLRLFILLGEKENGGGERKKKAGNQTGPPFLFLPFHIAKAIRGLAELLKQKTRNRKSKSTIYLRQPGERLWPRFVSFRRSCVSFFAFRFPLFCPFGGRLSRPLSFSLPLPPLFLNSKPCSLASHMRALFQSLLLIVGWFWLSFGKTFTLFNPNRSARHGAAASFVVVACLLRWGRVGHISINPCLPPFSLSSNVRLLALAFALGSSPRCSCRHHKNNIYAGGLVVFTSLKMPLWKFSQRVVPLRVVCLYIHSRFSGLLPSLPLGRHSLLRKEKNYRGRALSKEISILFGLLVLRRWCRSRTHEACVYTHTLSGRTPSLFPLVSRCSLSLSLVHANLKDGIF